jgi:hypothetical protein
MTARSHHSHDAEKLSFPNDIAIDPVAKKLYTLVSNVPKLMYDRLDENNKFYVYVNTLDTVGHHCEVGHAGHSHAM